MKKLHQPVIVRLGLHGRREAHALELLLELSPEDVPLLVNRLGAPRGVALQVEHAPLLLILLQSESKIKSEFLLRK